MIIDFVFEKGIIPWDVIGVKDEETVEMISLEKTSSETRRLRLEDKKQIVSLFNKNIWIDGIEEVFFSVDPVFRNTFEPDRLPYSFEIPIVVDSQNKIIRVPTDIALHTDGKSQGRWKVAMVIQLIVILLLLAFCTTILALSFEKYCVGIILASVIISFLTIRGILARAKCLLAAINGRCKTMAK